MKHRVRFERFAATYRVDRAAAVRPGMFRASPKVLGPAALQSFDHFVRKPAQREIQVDGNTCIQSW